MDWASAQRELIKAQALADLSVDKEKEEQTAKRLADLEKQIAAEKEEADRQLERQRKEFEERMRKIKEEQESRDQKDGGSAAEVWVTLTDAERRAALKAFAKWRKYRSVSHGHQTDRAYLL